MTHRIVDLGYYGPYWRSVEGAHYTPSLGYTYSVDLHSRVKTALEAVNGGNDWSVGRLIYWMGSLSDFGWGFVIYHLDGAGSPTGREWFITWAGRHSNQYAQTAAVNELWEDTTHWSNYFQAHGSLIADGMYAIHYHKGGLLGSTYDINESLNDARPPATNPYVDADSFMPTFATRAFPLGVSLTEISAVDGAGRNAPPWCLVYNHDVPFVGLYISWRNNRHIARILLCGDILTPRAAGDTFNEASLYVDINSAFSIDDIEVSSLTSAGAQQTLQGGASFGVLTELSGRNQPDAVSSYDRDLVPVGDKGFIDPDVFSIQGYHDQERNKLYDSQYGCMIKVADAYVTAWPIDTALPFIGWPLNPQKVYRTTGELADAILRHELVATSGVGVGDGAPVPTWTAATGGVVWTSIGSPIYRASAASNGLPSIEFVPSDYFDADSSLGRIAAPVTYTFVIDLNTDQGTQVLLDGLTGEHEISINSSEKWVVDAGIAGTTGVTSSAGLQFVCAVFDGDRSFVQVNALRTKDVDARDDVLEDARLGANQSGSSGLNGYLHEFKIWEGRMPDTQIATEYAAAQATWSVP